MAYTSTFRQGEAIFHDSTDPAEFQPPPGKGRGLLLGRRRTPLGAIPNAPRFPQELLIPRSEWQERIKEMEQLKTRCSDITDRAGLPCKDQAQTNYCWINAPTYCVEVLRVMQNQPPVILSPASGGAQIKGYQNVGGFGEEALSWIAERGLVPVDRWPANAIDRRYATAENAELARQYRVSEWMELVPRNDDELISCLLRRLPVALGYNWWGHEVTGKDAVWIDGTHAIRIRNSWSMGWGSQGYAILQGARMRPDDAVVPRVALAA